MSTIRYKSDAVIRDAVLKYYVVSWFGSLGVVVVAAVMLLAVYDQDCRVGFKYALAFLPVVHVVSWLIIANLMCAQFQVMSGIERSKENDYRNHPPTPSNEHVEIPISKGEKTGTISWD